MMGALPLAKKNRVTNIPKTFTLVKQPWRDSLIVTIEGYYHIVAVINNLHTAESAEVMDPADCAANLLSLRRRSLNLGLLNEDCSGRILHARTAEIRGRSRSSSSSGEDGKWKYECNLRSCRQPGVDMKVGYLKGSFFESLHAEGRFFGELTVRLRSWHDEGNGSNSRGGGEDDPAMESSGFEMCSPSSTRTTSHRSTKPTSYVVSTTLAVSCAEIGSSGESKTRRSCSSSKSSADTKPLLWNELSSSIMRSLNLGLLNEDCSGRILHARTAEIRGRSRSSSSSGEDGKWKYECNLRSCRQPGVDMKVGYLKGSFFESLHAEGRFFGELTVRLRSWARRRKWLERSRGLGRRGNPRRERSCSSSKSSADTKAATLERIIQQYNVPGGTIRTDMWRGYNNLSNLWLHPRDGQPQLQLRHPATGVHTQRIEGL
ncbi:hypothetical protein OSTOST_05553, partial [Ostertagia ostertagi]